MRGARCELRTDCKTGLGIRVRSSGTCHRPGRAQTVSLFSDLCPSVHSVHSVPSLSRSSSPPPRRDSRTQVRDRGPPCRRIDAGGGHDSRMRVRSRVSAGTGPDTRRGVNLSLSVCVCLSVSLSLPQAGNHQLARTSPTTRAPPPPARLFLFVFFSFFLSVPLLVSVLPYFYSYFIHGIIFPFTSFSSAL